MENIEHLTQLIQSGMLEQLDLHVIVDAIEAAEEEYVPSCKIFWI